jgi:RNA polymerase sigma-70 factor (ECF subfamily)
VDAYLSTVRISAVSTSVAEERASPRLTSEPTPHSDEYLVSKLQLGEREALAELFKRHSTAVYHVGRKILRDSGEADDLVQEVFLYVCQKCEHFESSRGSARSWIFQIAYTQAFLRRRKLKSIGFYSSAIADDPRRVEPYDDLHADYDYTVEGVFGRNRWKKGVEDLTQDQRETFRLHFFEGYTFAEIAEKLGQSYANIRNHHYRGLEKLRKYVTGNELNRR